MSLFTKQEKPKTATKPIRCMKVVRCSEAEKGYKPRFCVFTKIVYRIGEIVQVNYR